MSESNKKAEGAGARPRAETLEGGVAVVIGASLAGSMSARVLADKFDRVVLIDRDDLQQDFGIGRGVTRKGVPHSRHFHALLGKGCNIMEELYPGFIEEAQSENAVLSSITGDTMNMRRFGWAPRFPSDLKVLNASRELIERIIRNRTRALGNVALMPSTRATGLITSSDGRTVIGVRVVGPTDSGEGRVLSADLVVDASGRQSNVASWLTELGQTPEGVKVDAHWGYTSAFVRMPDDFKPGWDVFSSQPRHGAGKGFDRTRGVAFWVQDGDHRWILTAVGCAKDYPPADKDGFFDFIRSLGYSQMDEVLDKLTIEGEIEVWRNTANRRIKLDQVKMPERLIVLGDAVAAFNPVYGQGMTVAAIGAITLRDELELQLSQSPDGDLAGLSQRFQEKLAETIAFCWSINSGADYRIEGVDAPPPPAGSTEAIAYFDRVEALSSEDPQIYLKIWETTQMLRTPDWMYEDSIRSRVIEHWDRLGALVGRHDPVYDVGALQT